jgi:hypothetical protein
LYERQFAGKAGVQCFFAHPQFGGKIVHADSSEAMHEKLTASRAGHLAHDSSSGRRLLSVGRSDRHVNTPETQ